MEENRDENKKILKQKKSLIIKQISAAKSKVLKYLDDIEKKTHKIYGYPRDKLYSMQHRVDYRNNQSGRLCVFHSLV
jgi:hypothetical protein